MDMEAPVVKVLMETLEGADSDSLCSSQHGAVICKVHRDTERLFHR